MKEERKEAIVEEVRRILNDIRQARNYTQQGKYTKAGELLESADRDYQEKLLGISYQLISDFNEFGAYITLVENTLKSAEEMLFNYEFKDKGER